jgi:hypothetical protein
MPGEIASRLVSGHRLQTQDRRTPADLFSPFAESGRHRDERPVAARAADECALAARTAVMPACCKALGAEDADDCQDREGQAPVDGMARVTFENCRDYRDCLIGEELSPGTIANHLKTLNTPPTNAAAS